MGVFDRFLLVLYASAASLAALGILAICARLVPGDFLWTNFVYLSGRWETAAAAAVFLLAGLRLFAAALRGARRPKPRREAVIVRGRMGEVQVAVEAVRDMVDKTARSVRGVREVKVDVKALRPPVKDGELAVQQVTVSIRASVGQECHVAEISDAIRELVGDDLTNVIGLETFDVEVLIDGISNAPVQKQRVV